MVTPSKCHDRVQHDHCFTSGHYDLPWVFVQLQASGKGNEHGQEGEGHPSWSVGNVIHVHDSETAKDR